MTLHAAIFGQPDQTSAQPAEADAFLFQSDAVAQPTGYE